MRQTIIRSGTGRVFSTSRRHFSTVNINKLLLSLPLPTEAGNFAKLISFFSIAKVSAFEILAIISYFSFSYFIL